MPLDPQRLQDGMPIVTRHEFTRRDTMLYALGVGAAMDNPLDLSELKFVYEENLQALPTMAVVLGYPGFWQKEPRYGLNWQRTLHAGQSIEILRPLPVEGIVRGETTIENIYDKGAEKGAIVNIRRDVIDEKTGDSLAVVRQTSMLRGDGGFGGERGGTSQAVAIPERDSDATLESNTLPGQALIYRLSGDYNPLHIDPEVARAGGFDRPILHGLCTFGVVGRRLLAHLCADDGSRMRRLDVRFSRPVFPGETIKTEVWMVEEGKAVFRSFVKERDVMVLNNGYVEFE